MVSDKFKKLTKIFFKVILTFSLFTAMSVDNEMHENRLRQIFHEKIVKERAKRKEICEKFKEKISQYSSIEFLEMYKEELFKGDPFFVGNLLGPFNNGCSLSSKYQQIIYLIGKEAINGQEARALETLESLEDIFYKNFKKNKDKFSFKQRLMDFEEIKAILFFEKGDYAKAREIFSMMLKSIKSYEKEYKKGFERHYWVNKRGELRMILDNYNFLVLSNEYQKTKNNKNKKE